MPYFAIHNNRENHTYEIHESNHKPSNAGKILQDIQEVISYHDPNLETEKQRLQELQDKVITIRSGYGEKLNQLNRIQRLFVRFFSKSNVYETAGKCLRDIRHQREIVDFIQASNCISTIACAQKYGYEGGDEAEAHRYLSQLVLFNSYFYTTTGLNLYQIDEQYHGRAKNYDPNALLSEAKRLGNAPAWRALNKLGFGQKEA